MKLKTFLIPLRGWMAAIGMRVAEEIVGCLDKLGVNGPWMPARGAYVQDAG